MKLFDVRFYIHYFDFVTSPPLTIGIYKHKNFLSFLIFIYLFRRFILHPFSFCFLTFLASSVIISSSSITNFTSFFYSFRLSIWKSTFFPVDLINDCINSVLSCFCCVFFIIFLGVYFSFNFLDTQKSLFTLFFILKFSEYSETFIYTFIYT